MRDGEYVIVKDGRKQLREDLTEEEIKEWGTPSLTAYL